MTIYYILTEKCNLSCTHCIRGDANNTEMELDQAKLGLRQLKEKYPEAVVVFSGGEPTVYKHFTDILLYACELFQLVVINSNGTTEYLKNNIYNFHLDKICIQFSLDGTRKYHEAIRGKGSYDKTVNNIEFLNNLGIPIWLSTVVSKNNIDDVLKMPEILGGYNIGKWHVSPMMPFGNADLGNMLSANEWNTLVDKLIKTTPFRLGIRKLYDMNLLSSLSAEKIKEIASSPRNIEFRNCGCVSSKLYIYPDMSVYGCTCLKDMCLGNLIHDGIENIVSGEYATKIINHRPLSQKCMHCCFVSICNGGCYGMQHKYGMDLRCPLLVEA